MNSSQTSTNRPGTEDASVTPLPLRRGVHDEEVRRRLTYLRGCSFDPDDLELRFWIDAAYILGLITRVENFVDEQGSAGIEVIVYADDIAVRSAQIQRCWEPPATWTKIERSSSGPWGRGYSSILDDPRWLTHAARLVFLHVSDETTSVGDDTDPSDHGGSTARGVHIEWFAEFSNQPLRSS